MNSTSGWPAEPGSDFVVGPAVSPRRAASAPASGSSSGLLPPYVRRAAAAAPPATGLLDPAASEPDADLELDWPAEDGYASSSAALQDASYAFDPTPDGEAQEVWAPLDPTEAEQQPEQIADADADVPPEAAERELELVDSFWHDMDALEAVASLDENAGSALGLDAEEEEPTGGGDTADPYASSPLESGTAEVVDEWSIVASPGTSDPTPLLESPALSPPVQADSPSTPAQQVHSALADVMSGEDKPVLEEVAGRLERIALALREGRPIELFAAGSADPLEVLIAGYALGYSEAFRRVNDERRSGR